MLTRCSKCYLARAGGVELGLNIPMAGMTLTVLRLAVACRRFSGSSSQLGRQRKACSSRIQQPYHGIGRTSDPALSALIYPCFLQQDWSEQT